MFTYWTLIYALIVIGNNLKRQHQHFPNNLHWETECHFRIYTFKCHLEKIFGRNFKLITICESILSKHSCNNKLIKRRVSTYRTPQGLSPRSSDLHGWGGNTGISDAGRFPVTCQTWKNSLSLYGPVALHCLALQ